MIRGSPLRQGRWSVASALALAMVVAAPGTSYSDGSFTPPDCGMNSLYILLGLNGIHVSLEDLHVLLPPRSNDGFSLQELRGAANRCGLELWGVRLTRDNLPLDRPVLAHFGAAQGRLGHYAVLVPVGETGTMVQMIDPPFHPKMIDYASMMPAASSIKVLYPLRFWERRRFHVILVGVVLVAVALPLGMRGSRGYRKRRKS